MEVPLKVQDQAKAAKPMVPVQEAVKALALVQDQAMALAKVEADLTSTPKQFTLAADKPNTVQSSTATKADSLMITKAMLVTTQKQETLLKITSTVSMAQVKAEASNSPHRYN